MTARTGRPRLTMAEIKEAFQHYPPVLAPDQLAKGIGASVKTIYFWLAAGRLDSVARKRGKHWLIARDKAIELLFNGATWNHDESE